MKKSDLVVGEAYAYATGRDPSFAQRVVLVSGDLHTHRHRNYGEFFPALPNAKPTAGRGFYGVAVGWLVRKEDATEFLAQPAQLHMTWADWLVHREKRDAADKLAREKAAKERAAREEQARGLSSLLADSPWAGRVRVSSYQRVQSVPNDVLLEMLAAARVSS